MTAPAGFSAAGVACGLKPTGALDLALLRCEPPGAAAALFTKNAVKAAPVLFDLEVLRSGRPVATVVANSGMANACTGAAGLADCREMARFARESTGDAGEAFVLSTGVIGRRLPMELVEAGIREASAALSAAGGADAARAILTTDTHPKAAALRTAVPRGSSFTIGGMAKGAGMIHPDMATMLAILTTDAPFGRDALQQALRHATERSFHSITVDGDTSTNDTVLLLSSGLAAGGPLPSGGTEFVAFREALTRLCVRLARWIAADGEGARRLIEVRVAGAESEEAARRIGRVIATSPLVKTAIGAADPNWGRVVAAAGRSGEELDPARLGLGFVSAAGRVEVLREGEPLEFSEEAAAAILSEREVALSLVVGGGSGRATVWTCDLSEAYVRQNAAYRT